MVMHDYNKEGKKTVLLLHPMLASGKMMYELLGRYMGDDVRCLAPDFTSHGDEKNKEFVSAEEEAEKVYAYLKDNGIDRVDFAYGASLGGVVLTQLIRKNLNFTTAFFEGTSFFEDAKFLTKIIGAVFIKKHRRAVSDHARAVAAMGALYGAKYAEEFADQFISMSENSIKNIAKSCGSNRHAVLTPEEQKKCIFAYGSKDMNIKEAAKGCKKYYPNAEFMVWEGFDHCEKVTADTEAYIDILKKYL